MFPGTSQFKAHAAGAEIDGELERFEHARRRSEVARRILRVDAHLDRVARGVHVTLTTLSLLALVIYMFAISLTVIREVTPSSHGCFDSVLPAMNCLMVQGVFADQASMIQRMLAADVV